MKIPDSISLIGFERWKGVTKGVTRKLADEELGRRKVDSGGYDVLS